MNRNERNMFLHINRNLFRKEDIPVLDESLEDADASVVHNVELKTPVSVLLTSIFLGEFGADRFMLGDKRHGILKLSLIVLCHISLSGTIATAGNSSLSIFSSLVMVFSMTGILLFWAYDIITSYRRTKIRNFTTLSKAIGQTAPKRPAERSKKSVPSYDTGTYNDNYNTSAEGSYQR